MGLVIVLGMLFMPADGFGRDLCYVHASSGLPCPGCGLSRSVAHGIRGHLVEAIWYNPFGLLVVPYALAAVSSVIWPRTLKDRVRAWLEPRTVGFKRVYMSLLAAFLTYGAVRMALAIFGLWPGWH